MFVDSSVLVAILKGEPEAAGFTAALAEAKGKLWVSSIVRFEVIASLAISRARSSGRIHADSEDFDVAAELLNDLLREIEAKDAHLSAAIGAAALDAARTFGKLSGHPARLNMGDCFSYACAKAYRAPLLYKGEDFAQTDLA
ncbi:type II toxin-antitoxin system VapC family toxin [Cereibacter changlensis]|uniref:Ribonuclease VapC n=1 Tax=Cereibacter changlensis TaxID=402884 RepID=A0A4U0YWH5_9RHOB|nr:type II toxin-antitoxin system VapC family toxin [Cereibacter changlensis]TKA94384.1 type II toxin-antitoxin system VapC family toxin [Cereibacter changlensis]